MMNLSYKIAIVQLHVKYFEKMSFNLIYKQNYFVIQRRKATEHYYVLII